MRKQVLIPCILVLLIVAGSFVMFGPVKSNVSKISLTESTKPVSNKFHRVQSPVLRYVETNAVRLTNRIVRIGFNFVPNNHIPVVQ